MCLKDLRRLKHGNKDWGQGDQGNIINDIRAQRRNA